MEKKKHTFISFDWSLKHLLRKNTNHDVLEGFVSVILGRKSIKIHRLLESEYLWSLATNGTQEQGRHRREVEPRGPAGRGRERRPAAHRGAGRAGVRLFPTHALRRVHSGDGVYRQRGEHSALGTLCSAKNYEHVKRVYSINIVSAGNDVCFFTTSLRLDLY